MTKISGCRACGCGELETVLDLGSLVSCGTFPRTPEEDLPPTPVVMVRCADCGLCQLLYDTDPCETFGQGFGYRSATNLSMRMHLERIAKMLYGWADLRANDTVVDIGSNDGFFLRCLPDTVNKIGVDPTIPNYPALYGPEITTFPTFFDMEVAKKIGKGVAKCVTTIAMLYDVPDPNAFIEAVRYILAPDGVWFSEQASLPQMIDNGAFDVICHEHLMYFDPDTLVALLHRHGLKTLACGANSVNGGSMWTLAADEAFPGPAMPVRAPTQYDFDKFRWRMETNRNICRGFFRRDVIRRKVIHGLGASTKGNALLQTYGLGTRGTASLACISDRNPDKVGRFTPGTHIPILSEDSSRELRPDYYFALPWHFRDDIIEREREFLQRGGKLIFPLPVFSVVTKEALK